MHTGKFKLEISTLAIGDVDGDGKREVLSIPAGETVELITDPSPGSKTVDVLWEGRTVAMCTVGLNLRRIETRAES
jgi:hypothetical protein